MILKTRAEQLNFLRELKDEIARVNSTIYTPSDVSHDLEYLNPIGGLKDAIDLPIHFKKYINVSHINFTVKNGKLAVLIPLYNIVAEVISNHNGELDLNNVFASAKFSINKQLSYGCIGSTADDLIKLHRTRGYRSGLGKIFGFFITPTSKSFLDKYNFFNVKPLLEQSSENLYTR